MLSAIEIDFYITASCKSLFFRSVQQRPLVRVSAAVQTGRGLFDAPATFGVGRDGVLSCCKSAFIDLRKSFGCVRIRTCTCLRTLSKSASSFSGCFRAASLPGVWVQPRRFAWIFLDAERRAGGGGDVRRDGDREDAGHQGQDPGAATHPPPAEGEPHALLGEPLHGTLHGGMISQHPCSTPIPQDMKMGRRRLSFFPCFSCRWGGSSPLVIQHGFVPEWELSVRENGVYVEVALSGHLRGTLCPLLQARKKGGYLTTESVPSFFLFILSYTRSSLLEACRLYDVRGS